MKLLTPKELRKRWRNKIALGTLSNWRSDQKGPRPTKIGGRVFYKESVVIAYENRPSRKA
jgi:hypothetical protein